MRHIAKIPRGDIERIQIYINSGKKTLAAIKAETGADYIINGGLFTGAWKAVCHLKADGVDYASDEWNYYGYGWDTNDIRVVQSKDKASVRNYICCCELVRDGKALPKPTYNADMGGARQRTAMGLMPDGDLVLWCSQDYWSPEALRDDLASMCVDSAIMLDGGGSTQWDFGGGQVGYASRIVHNLILIYIKKKEDKPVNYTVCLDAGHGGNDTSNQSPDGKYKEHEFTLALTQMIKARLELHDIRCVMTRTANTQSVSLADRAGASNRANADLFVSIHTNATAGSGWSNTRGLTAWTMAAGGVRDELAQKILAAVKKRGIGVLGAGLFHDRFGVLVQTICPAVLVECAFHTNKEDVALLTNDAHRRDLADAISEAVCEQLGVSWHGAVPDEKPIETPAQDGCTCPWCGKAIKITKGE